MSNKTYLRYTLKPVGNSKFAFQVHEESREVSSFLEKSNFLDKTTGFRVASGAYPEIKDSMNIIYLRGSDSHKDSKVDITRTVGDMQMNNRMELVKTTLKNLVVAVKKGLKGGNSLKQTGVYTL